MKNLHEAPWAENSRHRSRRNFAYLPDIDSSEHYSDATNCFRNPLRELPMKPHDLFFFDEISVFNMGVLWRTCEAESFPVSQGWCTNSMQRIGGRNAKFRRTASGVSKTVVSRWEDALQDMAVHQRRDVLNCHELGLMCRFSPSTNSRSEEGEDELWNVKQSANHNGGSRKYDRNREPAAPRNR